MKCKICKQKTSWDASYGYEEFIVCPSCHDTILYTIQKNVPKIDAQMLTMDLIFALGQRRRNAEKAKENRDE